MARQAKGKQAGQIVKCRWCSWTRPLWKRSKKNKAKPRIAYKGLFAHVREKHPDMIAAMEAIHGQFGDGIHRAGWQPW